MKYIFTILLNSKNHESLKHGGKNFNKQWKKHAMYKRKWQQVENVLKTKTLGHITWFSLWRRSRQKSLVFSNQRGTGKVGGRIFFFFVSPKETKKKQEIEEGICRNILFQCLILFTVTVAFLCFKSSTYTRNDKGSLKHLFFPF